MDVNTSANALESFTQQTVADVFADCFPAGPGTTCTVWSTSRRWVSTRIRRAPARASPTTARSPSAWRMPCARWLWSTRRRSTSLNSSGFQDQKTLCLQKMTLWWHWANVLRDPRFLQDYFNQILMLYRHFLDWVETCENFTIFLVLCKNIFRNFISLKGFSSKIILSQISIHLLRFKLNPFL